MERLFYAIGETARLLGVNASTLRFWEKEFGLNPTRNKKGDRFYTPPQLDELRFICHLLKERKMTIEGAKQVLKSGREQAETTWKIIQRLEAVKADLSALKEQLDGYEKKHTETKGTDGLS